MEFQREEYVEKLAQRRGNGLVKVITGIRRCGKSYLLFRLFKGRLLKEGVKPNHIVEIALDVEKFEELRDPMALARYVRGSRGMARPGMYSLMRYNIRVRCYVLAWIYRRLRLRTSKRAM